MQFPRCSSITNYSKIAPSKKCNGERIWWGLFSLPTGCSYAIVGCRMVYNVNTINWLGSLHHELNTFHLSHIYGKPTNRQIDNLVWWGLTWHVNVTNSEETGFPILNCAMLNEFCTGPYLARIADSYVTNLRRDMAVEEEFVDLETLHQQLEVWSTIKMTSLSHFEISTMILTLKYSSVTTG